MPKEMKLTFLKKEGEEPRKALRDWLESLERNRGDRAALRRARDPNQIMLCPAYCRLLFALQKLCGDFMTWERERLAVLAGVLAQVKEEAQGEKLSFARQMAMPRADGGDNAVVSPLRFRRLLAAKESDDLFRHLCHAVKLLRGRAHLPTLAEGTFAWNDFTRRNWALDYYSINRDAQ